METERKTYSQDWPAYNKSQVMEKRYFLEILHDLCLYIPVNKDRMPGRPQTLLNEIVFCCVVKIYEGMSARRNNSNLEMAKQAGYLSKTPAYNTVLKYFNDPRLAPLLTNLIQLSAMPLKDIEQTFAADATGFSKALYSRWLDSRLVGHRYCKDWMKVNMMCGVNTNIVTHIIVTEGKVHEAPRFPELVEETAKNFRVRAVCADRAYSSRKNLQAAEDVGAIPFILFKKNATGRTKGPLLWKRMFHYFQYNQEEFMKHYYQRSNAESTFSMIKRKFGTSLMMRTELGMVNESLAKVLCHNICVLIHEYHRLEISLGFKKHISGFSNLLINYEKPLN